MKNLWNMPGPGDLVNLPDFADDDEEILDMVAARDLAEGELFATPGFVLDLINDEHYQAAWEEIDAERVEIATANPAQLLAVVMDDPSQERTMLAIGYLREQLAKHYAGWLAERAQELVDEDERARERAREHADASAEEAYL